MRHRIDCTADTPIALGERPFADRGKAPVIERRQRLPAPIALRQDRLPVRMFRHRIQHRLQLWQSQEGHIAGHGQCIIRGNIHQPLCQRRQRSLCPDRIREQLQPILMRELRELRCRLFHAKETRGEGLAGRLDAEPLQHAAAVDLQPALVLAHAQALPARDDQ